MSDDVARRLDRIGRDVARIAENLAAVGRDLVDLAASIERSDRGTGAAVK